MKISINSHVRKLGIASAAVLISTCALATVSFAQSQDNSSQSVAEAARKEKERKKNAPKENQVITEDTLNLRAASADASGAPPAGTVLNTTPVAPSGEAAPATDADSTAAKPVDSSTAADEEKKKAEMAAAVARTKELLAQAQSELDILKRQLALDSDSFYSNPDYARNTNGKAKLDDEKQSISDKQISVEDLKRKLTELMEKAGISADEAKPASAPQP